MAGRPFDFLKDKIKVHVSFIQVLLYGEHNDVVRQVAGRAGEQGKINVLREAQRRAKELGPHVSVQLFSGLKKEGVDELREVLTSWIYREERIVTL